MPSPSTRRACGCRLDYAAARALPKRPAQRSVRSRFGSYTKSFCSCSAMNDFDPAPGGEVSFGAFWTVLGAEAECPLSLGRADVPQHVRDQEGCAVSGHCGETCSRADYEVHHSLCPPLICTVSSVRKPASCVARNATTAAISSAFPIRRRTLRSIMAFSASGLLLARSICVSTMPGAGSDDPNAAGPSSRDRLMVSDSSAAFVAL